MVEPHSSNFRVITTIFLGVRIFRKFTVHILQQVEVQLLEVYKEEGEVAVQSRAGALMCSTDSWGGEAGVGGVREGAGEVGVQDEEEPGTSQVWAHWTEAW